jgi:hypothetical protein
MEEEEEEEVGKGEEGGGGSLKKKSVQHLKRLDLVMLLVLLSPSGWRFIVGTAGAFERF